MVRAFFSLLTSTAILAVFGSPPAGAATVGEAIAIGGQSADIALDETRGVLYIANFTSARIDVLGLADRQIRTSMHVAPGPSSVALSRDGRFLVVTHYGNALAPATPSNALTILDLSSGARQTFTLDNPPLGAAFGADGAALVATTTEFIRLDPSSGRTDVITTVASAAATANMPAAPGTPPVQIVAASLAASGDGKWIFGLSDTIRFSYDVTNLRLTVTGYTATPPLGPRVISPARDGSYFAAGWAVFDRRGYLQSQFPGATGALAVGTHAIDSATGLIYSQIPTDATSPPALAIGDADNLTVRDRLSLPENFTGRSMLSSDGSTLYGVSESGVLIIPVGALNQVRRVAADKEDLVFRGDFCRQSAITRTLTITDPGGNRTAFSLATDLQGVTITPTSGRTPATVQVTVDPRAFQDRRGTVLGTLTIASSEAANIPAPVRLLISNQRPDERGTSTSVPGVLADLLADPGRDRFYVLRQDRNQVLVFDGSGFFLVGTLRTGTTPTRMALTQDNKNLLVGHENSQLIYVYDLDTLQPLAPVVMPRGHYPRSIAAASSGILAASRVAGATNTIDRVDLASRTATTLPTLGVFQNSIATDTVLTPTPNGGEILAASADGTVMLYDAAADAVTVSRKFGTSLSGAIAASANRFVVGNRLMNFSLVPIATWSGADFPSGYAFTDNLALRMTGPATGSGAGGTIGRVDTNTGEWIKPTSVAEQPLVGSAGSAFTRTLAPLANGTAIVALTSSGFTTLAWNFDSAVVPPSVQKIVNAADLTPAVAPGALISVFGANLSPTNATTNDMPLPTAIGQSCLMVNGAAMPMMFVSPKQINAQLPLRTAGRVAVTVYTPGGVSDDFYLNVLSVAPAIFQSGVAGPIPGLPVIIKASNQQLVTPSNPIHPDDEILIYATGLGSTAPEVEAGVPPPSSPPATAVVAPDVQLGGVSLDVPFAGLVPGMAGVYLIQARAPSRPVFGAEIPLTINQGAVTATAVVRVVE